MKRFNVVNAIVLAAILVAGCFLGYLEIFDRAERGVIGNVSDLEWGRSVIELIQPEGEFFRESHYYPNQNHHFVVVFGRCRQDSFDRFNDRLRLDKLSGDLWNNAFLAYVPEDLRGDFKFSVNDCGFIGKARLEGNKFIDVDGVFDPRSGNFYIQIKTP